MASKVYSIAHIGMQSQIVTIEADVSRHMPSFVLVGLPDTAIQEARERIRSALDNSGLAFPRTKVTVNLAPANIRKEGSYYDIAIAMSIVLAQGSIHLHANDAQALFLGELALNGEVRPVSSALLSATYAKEHAIQRLYLPEANVKEAAYVPGVQIYGIRSLRHLLDHVSETKISLPAKVRYVSSGYATRGKYDFAEIKGQQQAKRACEIAAAGGHNISLKGAPGSGKTMLARSFISILPPLSPSEVIEVSKIYSYSGLLTEKQPLKLERPFRSPHHTASAVSLVGGGTWPKPGEVTLAHRGVLFLDEFPEFPKNVLEVLRQPLEDNVISISRASITLEFPADFLLITAQNPCPCGYWGDPERVCDCNPHDRVRYGKKISGPLKDRIDLHIHVPRVPYQDLMKSESAELSSAIIKRVNSARMIQARRFCHEPSLVLNSTMNQKHIKKYCQLNADSEELLMEATKKMKLSARGFYKTIKVARTIADLQHRADVQQSDILEALQYRSIE